MSDKSRSNNSIFIEDIADKLEEAPDCCEQYFNTATGEFVYLFDGSFVEGDEELAEEIENSDDYIRLPNQYEIREYAIMENFAESTPDGRKRERLFLSLNSRKPYRKFKDVINSLGLDRAYYDFRSMAYIGIAMEWCEENNIRYKSRKETEDK